MAKNKIIHQTTRKMSQLCRKVVDVNVRWGVLQRVSFVGHFFRFIWGRLVVCSVGKPSKYRRLSFRDSSPFPVEERFMQEHNTVMDSDYDTDSDLVNLKISLLGDCDIGKTTFVIKYVGNEQEKKSLQMEGLNLMDKTLFVEGARISCCIWDVAGDKRSLDQIPMACKDALAVLIMFDLTSRSTLNNVVGWYSEARKWNKTAIPILIGTKFDDFVRLPPDLQWTIVTQARAYARAMNATLFFSSATHNINVNKIFKFIMAKLFNLPWTVERNLRVGEPIIDF
ncbi:putative small GTPase superfamily, P-loop containing nucleoside triphosphate hydrolase [Lupinus albus]|uniref:Putative small GTPase superfamily, P-loop containing nucleoside triphosphate hydrolase n=1 Tax=Lupinus albus TaxID=3870 RepID=A0A6A4QKT5_LUPAL|nr:putative small GTPase superfamily, P-loop containing nucleoside triphosphate hydrolase [Lupinus albus]